MRSILLIVFILVSSYGVAQFIDDRIGNQSGSANLGLTIGAYQQLTQQIIGYYETTVRNGRPFTADENPRQHLELIAYDLDRDGDLDVIVTLKLPSACGSAGCITTIFMQDTLTTLYEPLNFRYAVTKIEPLESVTNGMHDLRINDDLNHRMEWNGATYELNANRR